MSADLSGSWAGLPSRTVLAPIVDATLLARDTAAITGERIDGPRLMDIVTEVYPLPATAESIRAALDFALQRLGHTTLTAVILTSALLDRLCTATGDDAGAILRDVLEKLPGPEA